MSESRRQVLERCDDVVQGITAVCWALEAGDYEKARSSAAAAQEQAKVLMSALLEEDVTPGDLRRRYKP